VKASKGSGEGAKKGNSATTMVWARSTTQDTSARVRQMPARADNVPAPSWPASHQRGP